LKRLGWGKFKNIAAKDVPAQLDEPTMLVADGVEVFVAMRIEEYYSREKSNPQGRMVRLNGVLYREMK